MSPLLAAVLPPGGIVGVVAPASPYNRRSDLLRGVAWWEARGYRVKLAEGIHERTDWTAGSPEMRARDLMAMFADPEVDAIPLGVRATVDAETCDLVITEPARRPARAG